MFDRPLYFNTINQYKFLEIDRLFRLQGRPLTQVAYPVVEILDTDVERVARAKALAAYRDVRHPVIVEHGGIFIEHLNNLPGALLKPLWDGLGSIVCGFMPVEGGRRATVRTALCYCDGKNRIVRTGELCGSIAPSPRGHSELKWDTVFIPHGETRTFAEMSLVEKLEVAPAAEACRLLGVELQI